MLMAIRYRRSPSRSLNHSVVVASSIDNAPCEKPTNLYSLVRKCTDVRVVLSKLSLWLDLESSVESRRTISNDVLDCLLWVTKADVQWSA